jgi:hypothetical protein
MSKDMLKFIWPATALACAAMIAAGVYFGLKSNQPPSAAPNYRAPSAAPDYGGPSTAPTVEGTDADRTAPKEGSIIVYVTRTGQCYHRATCSYVRRSKIPMELSEAKKRYRPCSKCRPPQ